MAVTAPASHGFVRRLVWSRDGLVNTKMCGLCLIAGLCTSHALIHGWDGYSPVLRVADGLFGVGALVGIWWRKRWPVGFAVAVALIGIFSTLGSCVILVGIFTVAIHRRWQVAVGVSVLFLVVQVPYLLIYPPSSWMSTLILAVLSSATLTGWGMFVRARRQLVASLRERAERAEAEVTWRSDQARRGERERMAREMHDVLAHRLSLLSVHAGALEFRPDAPAEEVARAAGVIRANAHEALEDLRSVIGVLRQADESAVPERPQPTIADLPALVDESRLAGAGVTLVVAAVLSRVPDNLGRSLYRIAQEGLTNARKHAPSSTVRVELDGGPDDGVTITVTTRLAATGASRTRERDEVPGSGMGLVGLRERTTLAGGWLDYGPTSAGVFRLQAWLPWPTGAAASVPDPAGGAVEWAEIDHPRVPSLHPALGASAPTGHQPVGPNR